MRQNIFRSRGEPGKEDELRAFYREVDGPRQQDYDRSEQRLGITKEIAWHERVDEGRDAPAGRERVAVPPNSHSDALRVRVGDVRPTSSGSATQWPLNGSGPAAATRVGSRASLFAVRKKIRKAQCSRAPSRRLSSPSADTAGSNLESAQASTCPRPRTALPRRTRRRRRAPSARRVRARLLRLCRWPVHTSG